LTPISLTRDVYVGTFGQALLVDFREKTPPAAADAMRRAAASLHAQHERFVYFALIEAESVPPGEPARAAYSKFFAEEANAFAAFVAVREDEGFRGAMVRLIVAQILNMLPKARTPFPRKIVSSLDEGARFASEHAPSLHPGELVDAFAKLRAMSPA